MNRFVCAVYAPIALAGLLAGCSFSVSTGNNASPAANSNSSNTTSTAKNSSTAPTASNSAPASGSSQTIAYPSTDKALFTVTAPTDWKLEPAEEEGGFFNLNGPTGAVVAFRSVPGTEDDLKGAIEETVEFVKDTYSDVKVGSPERSPEGFFLTGSGTNKTDGKATVFQMEWKLMKNGHIAEIWIAEEPDDKKGDDQAEAIIKSLKEI